ncbi:SRPBCC domain-containing protein [Micromonospora sp. CPCC 205539]|uniref:SRPBCC family protein n=1 Tax=Micromonospora sp. CPCC 205539 TaxID=3122408 RepID=UPI002FF0C09E
MKITNEFTVNTSIERAWAVLTDLEGIAPCLPGAQLTGVDGDVYQGKVRVKVGPVITEFAGTARFVERDDAHHRGVIDAKGRDTRSAGNAAALVTAQLRPHGDRTLVSVDTDLKISGKLAQFGSGMIKEVSGKLLAQFVTNLEAKLVAEEPNPATPAAEAASIPATPAPRSDPEPVPTASATAVATAPAVAVEPSPVETSPAEPSTIEPSSAPTSPAEPSTIDPSSAPTSLATPSSGSARAEPAAEPEALDLLTIAGGSIVKRLLPVAVGVVAVGAVIVWLVARR